MDNCLIIVISRKTVKKWLNLMKKIKKVTRERKRLKNRWKTNWLKQRVKRDKVVANKQIDISHTNWH